MRILLLLNILLQTLPRLTIWANISACDQQRIKDIALTSNLFILFVHQSIDRNPSTTLSQYPTSYSTSWLILL